MGACPQLTSRLCGLVIGLGPDLSGLVTLSRDHHWHSSRMS